MNAETMAFLEKHCLNPGNYDPEKCALGMLENMKAGLAGNVVDMPMIPTYLRGIQTPPANRPVMVIDAGGTNYRCALAKFDESGCHLTYLFKDKMPGTGEPVTWEQFINFVADSLLPMAAETDTIGFCFSYDADITPEIDGIVCRIDKEVVVTECEGKRIGATLSAALAERGFPGKRVLILNDTVAALLGGAAAINVSEYSDFVGMICGTGINTCAPVDFRDIRKISLQGNGKMLINFEAGAYSGMPAGDVDAEVDAESNIPGEKLMEKMCSGVYVSKVCSAALKKSVEEGLLPESVAEKVIREMEKGGPAADALARGLDENHFFETQEQLNFASELAKAVFKRSAHCMAATILAIMLLNDSGNNADKPMCVCAEGSLISRSKFFLPELEQCLKEIAQGKYHKHAVIVVGNETTLPGSAAAALLN